MDWSKYDKIPTEYATAREIGLAAATLGALARKGFVEVLDTTPKQYRKSHNPAIKIYQLCEEHKKDFDTYFILKKKNASYGMLCHMVSGTIVDCWGKPYNLTNVCRIEFRTKKIDL